MSRVMTTAAALALAVAAAPARAQAPAAQLPTAQAIVARYVDAVGGRAAIERTPGRWERGRLEMAAQGMVVSFENWIAGGRQYSRSELPGVGVVQAGFDGEVGWSLNPATGPMLMDGNQLNQARQAADPTALLHSARYVQSMQTVEETDFGGARCYRVRVTTPWGETFDEFFDATSGLLSGTIRRVASPQGDIEVTSRITEYARVGALRVPRVTRASVMGMEMVTTLDTVEIRSIPDSVFALPPEIRSLRGGR